MKRTRIFLVTPALNAASALEETILSIVSQAGASDIFYHVQDCGSTDQSLDTLRKWDDLLAYSVLPQVGGANIRFSFQSKPSENIYDAIAQGFAHFDPDTSDWMGWIGAGDLLLPGALATLSAIDQAASLSGVNWISGSTAVLDAGAVRAILEEPVGSEVIRRGLCDGSYWSRIEAAGAFFRGVLWKKIDPITDFSRFRFAGDWNLWRRFAEFEPLYQLNVPLGASPAGDACRDGERRQAYLAEIGQVVSEDARRMGLVEILNSDPESIHLEYDFAARDYVLRRRSLPKQSDYSARQKMGLGPMDFPERPTAQVAATAQEEAPRARILIHDAQWQFPAITEWHSYKMARQLLPPCRSAIYLAFPWATLIDVVHNGAAGQEALLNALDTLARQVPRGVRVVTVAQHIFAKRYIELFQRAGVTDIFWSHAVAGETSAGSGVNLHPFPLYPVQVNALHPNFDSPDRPYLFSFVGARANKWYLTEVRNWILDAFSDHPAALVIGRDTWHYNKIVYDHQIRGGAGGAELIDHDASEKFKQVLADSQFTLCPSGSGPNSIRLWEAIGAGSIPVILSDTWAPPGNRALWSQAAVFWPEDRKALRRLPAYLEKLAKDPERLRAKRAALRQLWTLYGPDDFIHDVRALFLKFITAEGQAADAESERGGAPSVISQMVPALHASKNSPRRVMLFGRHSSRTPFAYEAYRQMWKGRVEFVDRPEDADFLATGFDIDFRDKDKQLRRLVRRNPALRLVVISEEPLWDTIWSVGGHSSRHCAMNTRYGPLSYTALNHFTSNIFEFGKVPYFVTTSDSFILRYGRLFQENSTMRPKELLSSWMASPIRVALYAEKRTGDAYDLTRPDEELFGLSVYRTRLASAFDGERVVREGKGWTSKAARQNLPDWHLDKLAALRGRTRLVSALENTHSPHYITEKLFDAFAVGGIPLYFASPNHRVHDLVGEDAYLNLFGSDPNEAAAWAGAFEPGLDFAEAYCHAQHRLAALFLTPDLIVAERRRVIAAIADELDRLFVGVESADPLASAYSSGSIPASSAA